MRGGSRLRHHRERAVAAAVVPLLLLLLLLLVVELLRRLGGARRMVVVELVLLLLLPVAGVLAAAAAAAAVTGKVGLRRVRRRGGERVGVVAAAEHEREGLVLRASHASPAAVAEFREDRSQDVQVHGPASDAAAGGEGAVGGRGDTRQGQADV